MVFAVLLGLALYASVKTSTAFQYTEATEERVDLKAGSHPKAVASNAIALLREQSFLLKDMVALLKEQNALLQEQIGLLKELRQKLESVKINTDIIVESQ